MGGGRGVGGGVWVRAAKKNHKFKKKRVAKGRNHKKREKKNDDQQRPLHVEQAQRKWTLRTQSGGYHSKRWEGVNEAKPKRGRLGSKVCACKKKTKKEPRSINLEPKSVVGSGWMEGKESPAITQET